MNPLASKTISFLRFPLIVMVLFIHTSLLDTEIGGTSVIQEGQYPVFEFVAHLVGGNVARVRIPLFFFISGFLFFSRADFSGVRYSPSPAFYLGKFRRRINTLLIPYLFWNLACFAVTAVAGTFVGSEFAGGDKTPADYVFSDWLEIFWQYKNGMPADQPLWFMRDLIILTLCTPLVFIMVRHLKTAAVAVLGLCWAADFWFDPVVGLSIPGVFWFSFGAFFSANGKDFLNVFMPLRRISLIVFLLLVAAETTLWKLGAPDSRWLDFLYNTGVLAGSLAILAWTARGLEKGVLGVSPLLVSSAFFVYAFHSKPLTFLNRFFLLHLSPVNDFTLIVAYVAIPAAVVLAAICVYAALKKCLPRLTNIITGGR